MNRIFTQVHTYLLIIFVLAVGLLIAAPPAMAADPTSSNIEVFCANPANKNAAICDDLRKTGADAEGAFGDVFKSIVNALLLIAGIIATIMIIVSGIRMNASRGDPGAVTKSRNTLLYSIVGLIIASTAFAIVNFVLSRL